MVRSREAASQTMGPPLQAASNLRDGAVAPPQDDYRRNSASDDDADHVGRRAIFFLDLRARRGAVFRRQQAALFGQYHPAIAPPIRQHALIVDEVIALLGREDAGMRLVKRIEKDVVGIGKQ